MGLEEEEDEGEGEQDRHADGEDEDQARPCTRTPARRDPALEQRLNVDDGHLSAAPRWVRTHRSWASGGVPPRSTRRRAHSARPGRGKLVERVSPCAVVTPEPMAYSKLSLWAMIS